MKDPFRFRVVLAACLAALAIAAPARTRDIAQTRVAIDRSLDRQHAQLDTLYRDIHEHPELAFLEVRTANILSQQMRALGFEVTERVAKTGVVAIYRNGPGPAVMVRTELDALALRETTGLPYASTAIQTWEGKPTPVAHAP